MGKSADGYHSLETLLYPLPQLCDLLEVGRAKKEDVLRLYGLPIPGDARQNLCLKALRLLRRDFDLPPTALYLYKNIPAEAGLGGGSSDAAACLKLLNDYYALGLAVSNLREYGLNLGMDVPFFIQEGDVPAPCMASGRGELLRPFPIDLSAYEIRLCRPDGRGVSTAEAYANVDLHPREKGRLELLLGQGPECWTDRIVNDFEPCVFRRRPEIQACKENLYRQGAVYASMSGSGSAVYGLFRSASYTDKVPEIE